MRSRPHRIRPGDRFTDLRFPGEVLRVFCVSRRTGAWLVMSAAGTMVVLDPPRPRVRTDADGMVVEVVGG